jgi:hypothetical protein
MARCARKSCGRWRPGFLVRIGGLGLVLDDAWYCSTTCLEAAARERLAHTAPLLPPSGPASTQPRLGGVIAVQKKLERAVVELAASEQARTGLRIGSQLVELGVVTKLDVLRALAAQSGVGFLTTVDTARLSRAPGNLSPSVVNALRVVPFEADRRHDVLKVACTAPVPRRSLAALRELTGSIIEPYLVADEQWPSLLQAYGTAARRAGALQTHLPNVEALASKVAEAARESGGCRMSEARYDENLWVRLDAGGRIEEFWLTIRDEEPAVHEASAAVLPSAPRARRARAPRAASAQPRPRRARATAGVETPAVAAGPLPAAPLASAPVLSVPAAATAVGPASTASTPAAPMAARPVVLPRPRRAAAAARAAATTPATAEGPADMDLTFLESWETRTVPLFER